MPPFDKGGGTAKAVTEGWKQKTNAQVEQKMKSYNHNNLENARKLRKEMTIWERKLWFTFLRYYPIRFCRQMRIENYIVDFYCAKAKLIIELDGGGHYEDLQEEYDRERDSILQDMGFSVLRITNLDIDNNYKAVCEMIDGMVRERI